VLQHSETKVQLSFRLVLHGWYYKVASKVKWLTKYMLHSALHAAVYVLTLLNIGAYFYGIAHAVLSRKMVSSCSHELETTVLLISFIPFCSVLFQVLLLPKI